MSNKERMKKTRTIMEMLAKMIHLDQQPTKEKGQLISVSANMEEDVSGLLFV